MIITHWLANGLHAAIAWYARLFSSAEHWVARPGVLLWAWCLVSGVTTAYLTWKLPGRKKR